jgi:hypothetical protein
VALVRTDVSEERHHHHQGEKSQRTRNTVSCVLQLLDSPNAVLTSLINLTLMMEATRSSETSVHTRSTRRHIPENGILRSHLRENHSDLT